jgi:GT2 family glycosyltransferase
VSGPPPYVIVPVRDQVHLTRSLLDQLREQRGYQAVFIFDNGSRAEAARWLASQQGDGIEVVNAGGLTISQMWNAGVHRARERDQDAPVAFLNNDLRLGDRFLVGLAEALHADAALWAVSPQYDGRPLAGTEYVTGTFKSSGLAGFAFMVTSRAFDHIRFDEGFRWWFGDDDLVAQIEATGHKVGITAATTVDHVNGGSQTLLTRFLEVWPDLVADQHRMRSKWGHD